MRASVALHLESIVPYNYLIFIKCKIYIYSCNSFISLEIKAETYSIFGQQRREIFGDTSIENDEDDDDRATSPDEFRTDLLSRKPRNADRNRPKSYNSALTMTDYNSDEPPPVIDGDFQAKFKSLVCFFSCLNTTK